MTNQKEVSFTELAVGQMFTFDGDTWVKKSTRTAYIFGRPTRWFYFTKSDRVIPCKSRIDS